MPQLIRNGVEWIGVIDPKRGVSQAWAKNIPQVHIFKTANEQIDAIHDFRRLMEARYMDLELDETKSDFPRRVMIIEEQNSWINYMVNFWNEYRSELEPSERGKIPRQNPAIADLNFILSQGRQARMNIISVFQRMSAKAAGGGDARENYGCKILSRFSPQSWKLLIGTSPVPRSSKIPGRAKLVIGDTDRWIQMGFITESEAREYAAKADAVVLPDDDNGPDEQFTSDIAGSIRR